MSESLKKRIEDLKNKSKNPWSNLIRWKDPIIKEIQKATKFIPDGIMPQRAWHITNDVHEIVMCPNCKIQELSWHKSTNSYADTCSAKCAAILRFSVKEIDTRSSEQRKNDGLQKRRDTNLKKYGHINVLASEKVKDIKRAKYGTGKITNTENFKIKRKQSMLDRYGVEFSGQSEELQKKKKQTTLRKYDVNSYSKTEQFKQQLKDTYQLQFGVDHHMQTHLSEFTINKLKDRDWLYEQHIINERPIDNIAKELNFDPSTLFEYYKKYNIVTKRFPISQAEKEIGNFISQFDIKIITNTKVIPPYEVDIYIPSHQLAIEYCGLYWHCSKHKRLSSNYHKEKLNLCNEKDIRLITIFEDEWAHKQEIVKIKLLSILKKDNRNKIYARNTKIINLVTQQKQSFFETNHIQGDGPGSINIGLTHNNELVACMSFIKQKNDIFILNRYATSCPVLGGFSKLLSSFKSNYKWNKIISFADLRWSEGDLYDQTGWKLDKILPPDYYYVDIKNLQRIHKFNFRHKNLPRILGDKYNPKLSESENTENNNLYKIYNCGLKRYILCK